MVSIIPNVEETHDCVKNRDPHTWSVIKLNDSWWFTLNHNGLCAPVLFCPYCGIVLKHEHDLHHCASHPTGYEVFVCLDDDDDNCGYIEYRRSHQRPICGWCFADWLNEDYDHFSVCSDPSRCGCECNKFGKEEN